MGILCRCTATMLCLLAAGGAGADPPPKKATLWAWLGQRLSVQQVVKDKNSVDKPAYLSLTFPKDGPTQKDTSVGIVLDAIAATSTLQAGLTAEFVEKTGVDKPQNNLGLGLASTWVGHIGGVDTGGSIRPAAVNPIVEAELKYRKDGVQTTKGLAGAVRFTLLTHPRVFRYTPYQIRTLFGPHHFKWEPRIGLELEDVISAKTETEPMGTWLRSYAEIAVYLYPFGQKIGDRLVFSWDYAYRRDVATPSSVEGDSHNLRTYSALFYVDSDRRFSLGVDRVSGQDPSQGFKDQEFVRVSFKLRLKPS